jgi:hypothetical protein
MTAAHSLRSYDVMQPQSSGGGVTGGTNYLIKKLSATTFSLHPYNSSQDGSQGYINPATGTHKVYDDFANDVRISINSSGFPTQWWGYPHLPNSGLVKEVRTNGCSIPGIPTTDCLRLYHTRPDGVTDGMAYGVDTSVTAGVAHTVSFWTKTVNAAAVGQYIGYQIYNYSGGSATGFSFNASLGPVGVWVKQSMTFTPVYTTCISYFFPSSGNIIYDLAHIQFETGSTANAWTNSSRSTTQSLLDLTGNNTLTISSLTYSNDNNNSFSFNGSNSVSIPFNSSLFTFNEGQTIIIWMKNQSPSSARRNPYNQAYAGGGTITHENDTTFSYYWGQGGGDNSPYQGFGSSFSVVVGETAMICLTRDTSTVSWYKNGVLGNSTSNPYGGAVVTGTSPITIGNGYAGGFAGSIYTVMLYNRALTAAEVAQNFNALRGRYGI